MDSKEPLDIKSIFAEAINRQSAEERSAYLDDACMNDATLRSKIKGLIKAHDEAGDFLRSPSDDADVTLDTSLIEGPGTKIGRY